MAPVGSLFSDVLLPAVAVDADVLGEVVAAAAGAAEGLAAAAAGDALVVADDAAALLFTPPWCEQAPLPAFDVEPSLHVTVVGVAVACAFSVIGATKHAAATAAVMRDRGRMHTSRGDGQTEPTSQRVLPERPARCSRVGKLDRKSGRCDCRAVPLSRRRLTMTTSRMPNRDSSAAPTADAGTRLSVLIIDDEAKIRAAVRDALLSDHVEMLDAESGAAGLSRAESRRPDLVLVDLGLPDMEGLEVVRALRRWSTTPIIVLTARHAEDEKVALLDAGADDYVTKPFSLAELRARVRAQLRRARMPRVPGGDAPVRVGGGDLEIDLARRVVTRRATGDVIHLTPTEWSLLEVLVRHGDRPVTHRQLYHAVWGNTYGDTAHYLRVYVAHLRRKLERDPYQPSFILTEPGVGYRLTLDAGGDVA